MGSKVGMLAGSLGQELLSRIPAAERFVDLFAGSGAVARFVATRAATPTIAVDLMGYSRIVSAATIERTTELDPVKLLRDWQGRAEKYLAPYRDLQQRARALSQPESAADVAHARALCDESHDVGFIWSHYGGYYFSPTQALELAAFYAALPRSAPHRLVAHAALIHTASSASASPGHTAQPFRPTERLLPHLRTSWRVDVRTELSRHLATIAPRPALARGEAVAGDSVEFASARIRDGDLVFCDPPYSEAQYSRFYHVLEGIAKGGWERVEGAGRAPAGSARLSSDFSRRSRAVTATAELIAALARHRTTVIWTYPEGDRSNGLTVEDVRSQASRHFKVSETRVPMRHSTLGGSAANHELRNGRRDLHEVIFVFEPKG